MAIGTNQATVTTHANWIPETWLPEMRGFRDKNMVMAPLVKNIPFVGEVGDTVHIPDLSRLAVGDASEGGTNASSVVTEGEFNGVITRHRYSQFQVPDRVRLQSKYGMTDAYTMSAGRVIAEDLDSHIFSLESGMQGGVRRIGGDGATAWDGSANTNAGNGTHITDIGLRQAILDLDLALVPQDGRASAWNPRGKNQFLGINRFVEYQSIGAGNMPIRTGLFGEIFGLAVHVTTQTPTVTADDTTTLYDANMIFHQDAIVLAMQMDIRAQSDYVLQNLSWLVVVDYIGQAFEFRDDHAVSIVTPRT